MIALLLALALSHPNPKLTPGAVRSLTTKRVCAIRWGKDRRHVTVTMKRHVAAAYGIAWEDRSKYEFDHLVSRELGGADLEANIWPQAWLEPGNARRKDRLENRLHVLVCAGEASLKAVQREIAADWVKAYVKYVAQ